MDTRYVFNPPRPLTNHEREVAQWVIDNGKASREEKIRFLVQLDVAWVASSCSCGCATIHFAIGDREPQKGEGLVVIGDFISGVGADHLCGVFAYSISGMLAGLEIYSLAEKSAFTEFPAITTLRHFDEVKST